MVRARKLSSRFGSLQEADIEGQCSRDWCGTTNAAYLVSSPLNKIRFDISTFIPFSSSSLFHLGIIELRSKDVTSRTPGGIQDLLNANPTQEAGPIPPTRLRVEWHF